MLKFTELELTNKISFILKRNGSLTLSWRSEFSNNSESCCFIIEVLMSDNFDQCVRCFLTVVSDEFWPANKSHGWLEPPTFFLKFSEILSFDFQPFCLSGCTRQRCVSECRLFKEWVPVLYWILRHKDNRTVMFHWIKSSTSKKILQDCKSKSIMPTSSSISKSSLAIWSRVFR